jgi:hypothetical protein
MFHVSQILRQQVAAPDEGIQTDKWNPSFIPPRRGRLKWKSQAQGQGEVESLKH